MALVKSKGNMYDWVTHMHTHLAGKCSHECFYCYVQHGMAQMSKKYKGPVRLLEDELSVNYGTGRTIFVEHMNDILAPNVRDSWVSDIIIHCLKYPGNKYVFQSKNPARACLFGFEMLDCFFGTTIESNREYTEISKATEPWNRYIGMMNLKGSVRQFVTIEPILDFDVDELLKMVVDIHPEFVNIGADSKGTGLPEPPKEKILDLIAGIQNAGIDIRKKVNLERILK